MTAQTAIRLDGVARRFGQRWVLRGIDLSVEPGSIVALTGGNGSGKTTLLRIIATLLRPTRGVATVLGHDTSRDGGAVRGRIGLLGHNSALYDDLTAAENLEFSLRMAGRTPVRDRLDEVLLVVGLAEMASERVRGFSAGMRRRLGIARLLLRPPAVLLLDEPYASFDGDGITVVNRFATDTAAAGGVVVLATHDLARCADLFTRRIHVSDGRLDGAAHTPRASGAPRLEVMQ